MFEQLLDANAAYAAHFELAELTSRPRRGVAILTCMDTRIEPLAMLGLAPGDANILRNAGARVTEDVLRSLCLSTNLLGVTHVAVLQHSGCALAGESDEEMSRRLAAAGVPDASRRWLAMTDPDAALRHDVDLLRSCPLLAAGTRVEGWRYDVSDGSVARLLPA